MGCDIHVQIESRPYDRSPDYWRPFVYDDKLYAPRNYYMFARLAGVRGDESDAVYPPRGVPMDHRVEGYWLVVVDHDVDDTGSGTCSRSDAEKWVASWGSVWWPRKDGEIADWVSNPDWHTPSWLTPEEYHFVLATVEHDGEHVAPEYWAFYDVMRRLQQGGYKDVRIVFWFDD